MSIGLYIVLAPLYLKSVRKLQEKRFVFVKILAIIIPENGAKVSKIKCFQFAQQTLLKEAGIPVVNFDLAVANTDDVDAFVATDHYSAGVVAGEHMIKDYPEGGKIAILDRTNDNAASQRIEGLLDTVGEKFEVVSRLDGGGKPETGLSITEDILQANPDLVAIYCINDECAQGAYSAITASGKNIGIYSANGGPEAKAAIKKDGAEGIWKCTAAQSPFTVGQKSAEVAYKILEGKDFEKETLISTFAIDASNVSEYSDSDWQ